MKFSNNILLNHSCDGLPYWTRDSIRFTYLDFPAKIAKKYSDKAHPFFP